MRLSEVVGGGDAGLALVAELRTVDAAIEGR